jgi:hypothetical protein
MKTNTDPLQPNSFYHIYNKGINGEVLFKEKRNYSYFLNKYNQYVSPIADTYAYCLLSNHFHLLIRTKSEEEIRLTFTEGFASSETFDVKGIETNDVKGIETKDGETYSERHKDKPISWIMGNAFSSLFKSYSMAINKAHARTGRLFEESFRRILVDDELYFSKLVYYIHSNPQKHGFVNDFRDYPHSSYHSHLSLANTKLKRAEVLSWFGNKHEYQLFHRQNHIFENFENFTLELE